MKNMTSNEMRISLALFKELDKDYNANSISKTIGISPMGALKILKKLEKGGMVTSKKAGKANFCKLNLDSEYTISCIKFLLQKEAEDAEPAIKRWVTELRGFSAHASIGVLFGSILQKQSTAKDIDLLLVFDKEQAKSIENMIKEKNRVNIKKIHAIKQTKKDLKQNLKNRNGALLSALKRGIVLFGYEELIRVIENG